MGHAIFRAGFGAFAAIFGSPPLSSAGECGGRGGNVCPRLSAMSW